MKKLLFLFYTIVSCFLFQSLHAQVLFDGKPVELAPNIAQNLRVTLDVNGAEKRLLLKTKNSSGKADEWQKFKFEELGFDNGHRFYAISTADKDGKKVFLTKKNGYVYATPTQPENNWKLIYGNGWKIMTMDRSQCMSIERAQDGKLISFEQCDQFPGHPNPPPGDPRWHESKEFKSIEQ